jgi:EAL domain-containing protein (putative c-di-GMP-specific phosphodiesterase class I)
MADPEPSTASSIDDPLAQELRAAVSAGDFELHYQPKVRCADGAFQGFEALVRWRHPTRGLVPPGQFIPRLGDLGLALWLGRWVMAEACRQMAAWEAAGHGAVSVSVNLSPGQLRDPTLPDDVRSLLREHGLGAGRLELEVTEAMLVDDPDDAIARLRSLRDAGARLSIDDFGTGWSSMAYFRHLPVQQLKLDRVFVQHVDRNRRDARLCDGVIALAHRLGFGVVAEGVENEAQAKRLAGFDCDLFQGFLYSRPLDEERAGDYLRSVGLTPRTPSPSA